MGIIGTGEIVKNIPVDKPGIMNLNRREVSLATEPLYRLRVYLETAAGFDYIKITFQRYHS